MKKRIKGTVIITDPCYVKGTSWHLMKRNTIYGDWSCMVYPGTIEGNTKPLEWDKKYFEFFNEYNFSGKSKEEKKELCAKHNDFKKKWLEENGILGEFCADSGEVAVYDSLDDKDYEWCEKHPWCATIIKDFDGEVEIVERNDEAGHKTVHVIGTGNKPFFSVQSGL